MEMGIITFGIGGDTLNLSKDILIQILLKMDVGILLIDSEGEVVFANQASKDLLGVTDYATHNIIKCHPKDLHDKVKQKLSQNNLTDKSWHRIIFNNERWIKSYLSLVILEGFRGIAVISKDATEEVLLRSELEKAHLELQQKYTKIKNNAITDALTGLFNRRFLDNCLSDKSTIATEYVGVIMIDINKFKQINDTLGHQEGDRYLKITASIIKQSIRESDLAIRYGGDEFLLILPGCHTKETEEITTRLEQEVANWNLENEPIIKLDLAVGYSSGKNLYLSKLIQEADMQMYVDKKRKSDR